MKLTKKYCEHIDKTGYRFYVKMILNRGWFYCPLCHKTEMAGLRHIHLNNRNLHR